MLHLNYCYFELVEFINSALTERPATSTHFNRTSCFKQIHGGADSEKKTSKLQKSMRTALFEHTNDTKGHCSTTIPPPVLNLMLVPSTVSSWAGGGFSGLSVAGILGREKNRVKPGAVFYSDTPQLKNNLPMSSLTHSVKRGKFLLRSFKRHRAKEEQEEKGEWEP